MSILLHPLWPEIRHFVRVEIYAPDGGYEKPRFRLEFKKDVPGDMAQRWTAITVPCVHCDEPVHPIRARRPGGRTVPRGHLYIAPACSLDVRKGCSRGNAVHHEYLKIRADIESIPAPTPEALLL